jgi:peptidoglycan hydrolase-like protein with peptidoglycan-binding domain
LELLGKQCGFGEPDPLPPGTGGRDLVAPRGDAMALKVPRFAVSPELQAASENNPPLRQGAKGEAVAILQQALIDLGFPMPISTHGGAVPDGIFGQETAAAVRAFQSANGLQVDGVVGRQTMALLEEKVVLLAELERVAFQVESQQFRSIS